MAFGCMVESIAREEKDVKVLREFRSREDLFDAAKKLFVDAKVGS